MKQWIRDHAITLTLLPVLSLMILIFCFSAQPAEESDDTSGFFVSLILKVLVPDYDSLEPEERTELEHKLSFFVRKTAHLTEYAMLGFALLLHVIALQQKMLIRFPGLSAFLIGALYALSDEMHQLLIPGRSGEGKDVLLDSVGVLLGVLFLSGLRSLRVKRRRG